jgi:hypothetical protein
MRTPATIATAILCTLVVAAPAAAKRERIPFNSGPGERAANAALERVGGGNVFRVRRELDADDADKRYRVDIRRGRWVYEVDVSERFRVTEIERERARRGDDDGTPDQGSGDN